MIKKRYEKLKCQRCKARYVTWILENPHRKNQYDMIPDPIGFCGSDCLERFIHSYNTGHYMEGPIIPKVRKIGKR